MSKNHSEQCFLTKKRRSLCSGASSSKRTPEKTSNPSFEINLLKSIFEKKLPRAEIEKREIHGQADSWNPECFHRISRCEGVDRCKLRSQHRRNPGARGRERSGQIHSDEGLCGRKPRLYRRGLSQRQGCGAANAHGREKTGHPDCVSGSGYGAGADALRR